VIYKSNTRGWNRTAIYSNCTLCKTSKKRRRKLQKATMKSCNFALSWVKNNLLPLML